MDSAILAYSRLRNLLLQFDAAAARVAVAGGYPRLPGSNMMVLITLAARPGLTQIEIADLLGLSKQAIVPIMDTLDEFELARRSKPRGKKQAELALTPKGVEWVDLLQAELEATFGADAMDRLCDALGQVRVSIPL